MLLKAEGILHYFISTSMTHTAVIAMQVSQCSWLDLNEHVQQYIASEGITTLPRKADEKYEIPLNQT